MVLDFPLNHFWNQKFPIEIAINHHKLVAPIETDTPIMYEVKPSIGSTWSLDKPNVAMENLL